MLTQSLMFLILSSNEFQKLHVLTVNDLLDMMIGWILYFGISNNHVPRQVSVKLTNNRPFCQIVMQYIDQNSIQWQENMHKTLTFMLQRLHMSDNILKLKYILNILYYIVQIQNWKKLLKWFKIIIITMTLFIIKVHVDQKRDKFSNFSN